MVDVIPQSFWGKKDLKILDSCCGNGNFHAYISTKTNLKNLYFNEINSARIANVKKYFGPDIQTVFLASPLLLSDQTTCVKKYCK